MPASQSTMQATIRSPGFTALQAVPPARATRKLAAVLVLVFLSLPIALLLVPWQQNVPATGRVTALDPLDRTQVIPAPVTGRLVRLLVQEGAHVDEGQLLAEMADQDPQYSMRLEQQLQFTRDKVKAAKDMVALYDQQLVHLEDSREQAISSASFALNVAIEKVRGAERDLEGLEAELEQKRADRERKSTLLAKGVVSELESQKAEADYLAARSKVDSAKAKVEQARNDEKAKMADVGKVSSDQQAKIEETKSYREDARSKVALAEKDLAEATTKIERQNTQVVRAPRSGYVLRVHAASSADLLLRGDPLLELVPDTQALAVELWVRGVDVPLISPGRKARLQFEGWPAVQFVGWPSVAVGTFGGVVSSVDAQGNAEGLFRALVLPDPDDEPWPDRRYLRQGVRTGGWLMLDTVSLGYEIWRQLNAFPPSVRSAPGEEASAGKAKGGGSKAAEGAKE